MKGTILIVEDHDEVRATLHDWLSVIFYDCLFSEAKSGEEAVALIQAKPPDIVLMDIGLPGMNGIDATRRIKTTTPQVQVVMVTIHENPDYKNESIAAGATAYVTKRKMEKELIPLLKNLLSQ